MKNIKILIFVVLAYLPFQLFAQDLIVYSSKYLSKPDSTLVFMPKGKSKADQLPLVFMLHGYSGTYKQWDAISNAQSYANEYGFIVVLPDGLYNSWYLNSPLLEKSQYERFFMEELYQDIISKYTPNQNNIFITGLSMGGHGALSIFLNNLDKFKSGGSTSGAVDLRTLGSKYGIDVLFGKNASEDLLNSFSVIEKVKKLAGTDRTFIFDCGTEDQFYKMNNELKALCDQLKIKATYISQPGGHNRAYWAKSIRQQMNFFKTLI